MDPLMKRGWCKINFNIQDNKAYNIYIRQISKVKLTYNFWFMNM